MTSMYLFFFNCIYHYLSVYLYLSMFHISKTCSAQRGSAFSSSSKPHSRLHSQHHTTTQIQKEQVQQCKIAYRAMLHHHYFTQKDRWGPKNFANSMQADRLRFQNVANSMQHDGVRSPNAANSMQTDRLRPREFAKFCKGWSHNSVANSIQNGSLWGPKVCKRREHVPHAQKEKQNWKNKIPQCWIFTHELNVLIEFIKIISVDDCCHLHLKNTPYLSWRQDMLHEFSSIAAVKPWGICVNWNKGTADAHGAGHHPSLGWPAG